MSAPEYEVRTIEDLFKIPPERMGAFCFDLMEWHRIVSNTATLDAPGFRMGPVRDVFRWRDDGVFGLRNVTVEIREPGVPEGGTE